MTKIAVAKIVKPGPHSLLVDRGREHCQSIGLCRGGAADNYAYQWVNRLLGNPPGNPAIEITAGPFEISFQEPLRVALCGAECGAECGARLSSKPIHNWSSFDVRPGDRLTLGFARRGLRAYLGIRGRFATPLSFESCQPMHADGSHKLLQRNDTIELHELQPCNARNTMTPWWLIPDYEAPLVLELYPGYQHQQFNREEFTRLLESEYRISAQSNRMGYRLEGPAVRWERKGITSEGIAYGSVQIPPDGQPIVLLNDRQTIGGYPKAGCVSRAACFRLSQGRPGQAVKFVNAELPHNGR